MCYHSIVHDNVIMTCYCYGVTFLMLCVAHVYVLRFTWKGVGYVRAQYPKVLYTTLLRTVCYLTRVRGLYLTNKSQAYTPITYRWDLPAPYI